MEQIAKALYVGNLQPKDIKITVSDSNLILSPEIEQRIGEIWKEKLVESKNRGKEIFNGSSYRVNHWKLIENILSIQLASYDFKNRLGLSVMIRQAEISPADYNHGGCFVGATVVTADNKYVMVELSGKSMNNNTFEILGGMAETDIEMTSDGLYLFDALHQELLEEAGIQKSEISQEYLQLFFRGPNADYGFHFHVETALTEKVMIERFINNTDVDIAALCFFNKKEYLEKLRGGSLNKILIASHLK